METDQPHGIWHIIDRLQTAGGVASVLAVGIAGAICLRYVLYSEVSEVPPILANSLSVIIGFYFGAKTVKISN